MIDKTAWQFTLGLLIAAIWLLLMSSARAQISKIEVIEDCSSRFCSPKHGIATAVNIAKIGDDRYVFATARHNVRNAAHVFVSTYDKKYVRGKVVALGQTDIALIEIKQTGKAKVYPLAATPLPPDRKLHLYGFAHGGPGHWVYGISVDAARIRCTDGVVEVGDSGAPWLDDDKAVWAIQVGKYVTHQSDAAVVSADRVRRLFAKTYRREAPLPKQRPSPPPPPVVAKKPQAPSDIEAAPPPPPVAAKKPQAPSDIEAVLKALQDRIAALEQRQLGNQGLPSVKPEEWAAILIRIEKLEQQSRQPGDLSGIESKLAELQKAVDVLKATQIRYKVDASLANAVEELRKDLQKITGRKIHVIFADGTTKEILDRREYRGTADDPLVIYRVPQK